MGTPQIIMICIFSLNLLLSIYNHGDVGKPEVRNFFEDFFYLLVLFLLMYWGGFFK